MSNQNKTQQSMDEIYISHVLYFVPGVMILECEHEYRMQEEFNYLLISQI